MTVVRIVIRTSLIVAVAVAVAWLGNMAISSNLPRTLGNPLALVMPGEAGEHRHRPDHDHHEGGERGIGAAGEMLGSAAVFAGVAAVTVAGSVWSRRAKRAKRRSNASR